MIRFRMTDLTDLNHMPRFPVEPFLHDKVQNSNSSHNAKANGNLIFDKICGHIHSCIRGG